MGVFFYSEQYNTMPFQKGISGNPGGRPKREWTWSSLIADELEKELSSKDGNKDKARNFVVKRLVRMAIDGDIQAQKEIMNRMDGMPKQIQEIAGPDGGALEIKIISENDNIITNPKLPEATTDLPK